MPAPRGGARRTRRRVIAAVTGLADPGFASRRADATLRLRDDVTIVERDPANVLLFLPEPVAYLRLTAASRTLVERLRAGATLHELVASASAFSGRGPAYVEDRVQAFLAILHARGFLEHATPPARARPETRLSRAYRRAVAIALHGVRAVPARARPVVAACWTLVMLGAAAAAVAAGHLVHARTLAPIPDALLWIAFIALVIPPHEIAHGVMCEYFGVPIGGIGLAVKHGTVRFFVDTARILTLRRRVQRWAVCAAGPFVDLSAVGIAALLSFALPEGALAQAARFFFTVCLLATLVNTTPLLESDGSHMVEALLSDELARLRAIPGSRLSHRPAAIVLRYRLAIVAHSAVAIAIVAIVVAQWGRS